MNRSEFASIMAYVQTGLGLPKEKCLDKARTMIYFDLLGDLSADVLRVVAKRLLLEHRWANLPTVAEFREEAAKVINSQTQIPAAEAWEQAWGATKVMDPEIDGSIERSCENLPAIVVRSMKAYGFLSLCYGREPIGVVRAQFMKIYEQIAEQEKQSALMPNRLKSIPGKTVEVIATNTILKSISATER